MRPFLVLLAVLAVMFGSALLLGPRDPAPPLPPELLEDTEWLAAAERISRLRLVLYVATLALAPLVLWLFVSRGSSAQLRRRLQERGLRNAWLLVACYTALLAALLFILQLPLDSAGFFIRRIFGLTAEAPAAWLLRQVLEWAVGLVLLLIAVEALYWLLRRFPRRWWLIASFGYVVYSLGLVYLQPFVITPLFFEQRPLADPVLQARIVQMGASIGVPVSEVLVIDASKQGNEGNAYFTGVGNSTRIVLYDTLLTDFDTDEILAILGHEMGHWREQHIWKSLILSWLLAPAGLFVAHLILHSTLPRWGIREPADIAGLPFLLLLLSLVTIASLPIQNWHTRRWEADADRIGVLATGNPRAFARTFVHLAQQNLSDPAPPQLVEALFATHPAIGRRVAAVQPQRGGP